MGASFLLPFPRASLPTFPSFPASLLGLAFPSLALADAGAFPSTWAFFWGDAFPSSLVAALLSAEGAFPSSSFAAVTGTRASSVLLGILSFFKPTSNSWYWSLVSVAATGMRALLSLPSFLTCARRQFSLSTFKLAHTSPVCFPRFISRFSANKDRRACLSGWLWIMPLGSRSNNPVHSFLVACKALALGPELELICS